MPKIYLAGGCFWGLEKYLQGIRGVISTEVGYANGNTARPTYEDVCSRDTGHAETVKVQYDPDVVSLDFLLNLYFDVIDPTSVNGQGGDHGTQYRTGVYYSDSVDLPIIEKAIARLRTKYTRPIAIEVKPLELFFPAEEYHQKYLDHHPNGYCHIGMDKCERARKAIIHPSDFSAPNQQDLRDTLTDIQFNVTQKHGTEPPFQNDFWNHYEPGIYVDVTSGEPLFVSSDKFESGCGWPSFSKPIDPNVVKEIKDASHGMMRTEVLSRAGNAHLGHVFDDGPKKAGGKRYCINSAALRFIPKSRMEDEGFRYLIDLVQ